MSDDLYSGWMKLGAGPIGGPRSVCFALLGRHGERRRTFVQWAEDQITRRTGSPPTDAEMGALNDDIELALEGGGGDGNQRARVFRARCRVIETYYRARGAPPLKPGRPPPPVRRCDWCEVRFQPIRADHVFCCHQCNVASVGFYKRQRERAVALGQPFNVNDPALLVRRRKALVRGRNIVASRAHRRQQAQKDQTDG